MSLLDGNNLDISDAAIAGGVLGFVEESLKDEIEVEDTDIFDQDRSEELVANYVAISNNRQLQLLYAENPELVMHLIKKAYKARKEAQKSEMEKEIREVKKEMLLEAQQLERQEHEHDR